MTDLFHGGQPGDTPNKGWERRRQILVELAPPNRTKDAVSDLIDAICRFPEEELTTVFRPAQDDELLYVTRDYLYESAFGIVRPCAACTAR